MLLIVKFISFTILDYLNGKGENHRKKDKNPYSHF